MRLIDADALDETFSRLNDDGWQLTRGDHKRMESVLFEMPTIDAEPVIHGEWIAENNRPKSSMFYCSICHRTCNDVQPIRKVGWKKRCRYAYCPNCGAKMAEAALGGDGDA